MKTWFAASLMFEAVHTIKSDDDALWEEVIVLVEAHGEQDAMSMAEVLGAEREHEYEVKEPVPHGVRWRFAGVERVCGIEGGIHAGTELFSRFLRAEEAKSLLKPFAN